MSRPITLFYASLAGGVLVAGTDGDTGRQFRIEAAGALIDPLTLFLNREEAAQWAAVLTEYADGEP